MKLTRRVLLLNFLPFIIALIVGGIVYGVSMALTTSINISSEATETIEETMERQALYNQLEKELRNRSIEEYTDTSMLDAVVARLRQVNSDIVIIHNEALLFSSIELSKVDINRLMNGLAFQQETIELIDMDVRYKAIELLQDQAYIFLIHSYDKHSFSLWLNIIIAALTFLIIFFFVSLYISRKISNEIIRPVERLKQAAIQISEGELNSVITEEGEGEVLELCRALEQMRIKLKESILLQQKYDSNRSFLVSSISHDLKTPVTSIKGYIEGILDEVANTPEKQRKYLLTAHRKTILINTMIEDLLLYSKLDLKQLPFNKQTIDFVAYITDGIQEYYEFMQLHNIKLEVMLDEIKGRFVQLDGDRFMRVVQNIIDNAIYYNDKEKQVVTIMLRETYSTIVLEVRDNGIGIKANEAERIFDRFYRSDSARSADRGSGLGLAIAKQIVEEHEGKIWVKSQEDVGTSILISLPKAKGA